MFLILGQLCRVFEHFAFFPFSYPPIQARATLIHILELQIQRRKQAVEDIKRYAIFEKMI